MRAVALVLVLAACGGSSAVDADGESPPSVSHPASAAPLAQGHILYSRITGTDAEFFVANPDGSEETPFAPGKAFEARNLSPDGSRLAVVAQVGLGPVVGGTVDVDGRGFRLFPYLDGSLNLACGVWASPRRLACEGWDDSDPSRAGIYTVRASDGRDLRRITHARDVPCDYSPDGTQLAFVRTGADPQLGSLMVMEADGGDSDPLLHDVALSGIACDWSPDGRVILVATGDGTLVTVTPSSERSPIVGEGIDGIALGATWSLDGSHILFSMTFEGDLWDVYVVAADGSNLTRITDSVLIEEGSIWLP